MPDAVGSGRLPLTLVVLTHNEALNIRECLKGMADWLAAVFVVDSGSTDHTVEIATSLGASVYAHPFETHARQWRWALEHLPITTDWVLALDADQQLLPELREELDATFRGGVEPHVSGLYINRRQIFRGRWIRYGGYYPKYLLKIFRRDDVTIDEADLVDHHFTVGGETRKLQSDLLEDNRNEAAIAVWTEKHNRYAVRQARQEMQERHDREARRTLRERLDKPAPTWRSLFGNPDERVLWLKDVWSRLPLFVRPCLYVTYRYILRLGFLDGREGFIFHVLQGFWYRLLVDINISELRKA
jgi:glycosyltransferase involved in cell wall biosynthesis